MKLEFRLDGTLVQIESQGLETLLDLLRDRMACDLIQDCCSEGDCGACVLFVNGELVMSCLVPAVQVQGAEVLTSAALVAEDKTLAVAVRRLSESLSCAICLPGFVAAGVAGAARAANVPEAEKSKVFNEALKGQLCPCGEAAKVCSALAAVLNVDSGESN